MGILRHSGLGGMICRKFPSVKEESCLFPTSTVKACVAQNGSSRYIAFIYVRIRVGTATLYEFDDSGDMVTQSGFKVLCGGVF